MATVKKVALAGASGDLGRAVLDQLLKHVFDVTILTRQHNTHNFPPEVKICPVDYSSPDSLVSALSGQDAVVSTMAPLASDSQMQLIDAAAAAAGVQRFIPSEFGSDTTNPKTAALPVYRNKITTQKALREKVDAADTDLTYTIVCNGSFLDWGITKGYMNIKEKRASLWNGGNDVFSTTTLPTIGKAVCSILAHLEETKNRFVRVHDTATTLNRLLDMGKKAAGPDGWRVDELSTEMVLEKAWAEYREGRINRQTMFGFIPSAVWGEGYGGHFQTTDNELLGIKEMIDAEVQAVVNKCAK